MATVTKTEALRPVSVTQDSGYNNTWTNVANTYDTSTSTSGTIVVTGSSQSGFKRKYVDTVFNFDTSHIPANATINSATLTVRAKQSATTNLNITASINENNVIASTLLTSSSANYTADVKDYVKGLSQLNINLTSAATSNRTFTLYDVRIDVDYSYDEIVDPDPGPGGGSDGDYDIIGDTSGIPITITINGNTGIVKFTNWDTDEVIGDLTKSTIVYLPYDTNFFLRFLANDGYTIQELINYDGEIVSAAVGESVYGLSNYSDVPRTYSVTFPTVENTDPEPDPEPDPGGGETTYLSKLHLGNVIVDKLYLGSGQVKKIYIGGILIYEYVEGGTAGSVTYIAAEEKIATANVTESYDSSTEHWTVSGITSSYDSATENLNLGDGN